MRVLIVGGTGFIGPYVVSRLLARGHEVALFHRGVSQLRISGDVVHINGARAELPSFTEQFRHFTPEVVLDTFAYSEQDARTTVEVFRRIARRLVVLSSMDVYRAYGRLLGTEPGPTEPVPLTEAAPLRSELYPYRGKIEGMDDYEKILVERTVIADAELPGTVLRLPMVHGPGDYQHRFFPYLKRMDDNRPAILLEEGYASLRVSRGYVENVAEAIALAVCDERATGRTYNVGETEVITEAEWTRLVGQAAGWDGDVIELPAGELPRHLDPKLHNNQHLVCNTTRIRQELGYEEDVSREEALRETVAWERRNSPEEVEAGQFDYAAEDEALAKLDRDATEGR